MERLEESLRVPSSFRDPHGFVIYNDRTHSVQRVIFPSYFKQYASLLETNLYADLVKNKFLINHELTHQSENKIIIEPKVIPFITYSYEWPFHVLKDAALLTLAIAKKALHHGMYLKDATSYNIQLLEGKPIFIDTLSFELYTEGEPWFAYGQFCRHFIAPLLLMKYKDLNFSKMLINYLDGIPIDLVSALLPLSTHLSPFIKTNIHLHAKKSQKFNSASSLAATPYLSKKNLFHILDYMELFISSLTYSNNKSEWGAYYNTINYSEHSFAEKNKIILELMDMIDAKSVWDAGGNNGHFSRLISEGKRFIITTDIDPLAVDQNYVMNKEKNISNIVPLVIDLINPSPGIGFDNKERSSFTERLIQQKIDCSLALALIHHLCLSNNCTFSMVLNYFKTVSQYLIIEFIPPEDSWASELLNRKRQFKHLFDFYNQDNFEKACAESYEVIKKTNIPNSLRVIYLLRAR